ncbi:hypothetical protein VZT92_002376 [Zoarces viviparus]|uniref:Uncharacterized protein n=1 Tax=Zoarces viviparus TaxID=48416 RepID=A0AAW1G0A8_ZOAVI
MAQSEMQRGSLKSEEFFFDSEASLLDQQDFDMSSCPFNDVFNSKDSHMEQINTFLKNVQVLLEAARFLESAERKDGTICGRLSLVSTWRKAPLRLVKCELNPQCLSKPSANQTPAR